MIRNNRPPYSDNAPLVARAAFTFNGRRFYPGDAVPQDVVTDVRRRRQLWNSRLVDVDVGATPATPAPPAAVAAQAASKPADERVESGEGDGKPPFVAVSKGFGRFSVLNADTGEEVAAGLSKADAQTKASLLSLEAASARRGARGPEADAGACPPADASGPSLQADMKEG